MLVALMDMLKAAHSVGSSVESLAARTALKWVASMDEL